MDISIVNLKECPEHIPQLAEWHHAEWQHFNPGQTLDQRIEKMQLYLNDDFIPSTFVALNDDELLGSAAIVECDLETHPELSPWLASVYVKKALRENKVGTQLVQYIMQFVRSQGYKSLYLVTQAQDGFYKKMLWKKHSMEKYMRYNVTIMSILWD